MKLNLIMPMAGKGSRFFEQGYELPKPLIKLGEKPFFYWATESIMRYASVETLVFIVLKEHVIKFDIMNKIKDFYPNAVFKVLDNVLRGAALTCIEGVSEIHNDYPILFNDCDHTFVSPLFYISLENGELLNCDGALLTFESNEPCYSYIEYDDFGKIRGTVEKKVVSRDAICGAYFFKNKEIFLTNAREYLDSCDYSEFFISGIYNIMAKKNLELKKILTERHLSFGTPEEFEVAQKCIFSESKWWLEWKR